MPTNPSRSSRLGTSSWADPNSALIQHGQKARQIPYNGDRTSAYRDFRRTLPYNAPYVVDIDQIEYRIINDQITPVALLELTRYDSNTIPHPNYLKAIIDRYNIRDNQGDFARTIASKLDCNAYIVLFRHTLDLFWLYNLTLNLGWWQLDASQYETWLIKDCSSLFLPPPLTPTQSPI